MLNRRSIFFGLIGATVPTVAAASSMQEDAVVVHRLVRAPVRRTFHIDIGDREFVGNHLVTIPLHAPGVQKFGVVNFREGVATFTQEFVNDIRDGWGIEIPRLARMVEEQRPGWKVVPFGNSLMAFA